ncbi:MAG: retroviral-like aspartic protease family protein [Phenylobacterium sp.]|uniref:retroviral-like aspartic protease family protein n=1 Tax=Phenylobacterium sp. TaxID=1871053 RepID=UPI0039191CC9
MIRTRRQAVTILGAALASPAGALAAPRKAGVAMDLQPPAPQDESDTAALASAADVAERMTAPVFINGQGPFDFVVDTGANRTVVARELALSLGLPLAGRAEIHGIAGVEPSETVNIGRLDIGRVASRRLRAPMLDRARLGADGLLGVDVMRNRRVAMDFAGNRLTIGKPDAEPVTRRNVSDGRLRDNAAEEAAAANVVIVPARYRFGQLIIIDADMGGSPVTAFLDSGSQNTVGNLVLHQRLKATPFALTAQTTVVELISATGQRAQGELSSVPPLRMGGLTIGNLSAVFADLHIFRLWELSDRPAILIGIDVMRHFDAVELDFANRRVLFRTPSRALRRLPPG